MSTVTPYLNLVKPAPLENFSRATYNNNLDLIDTAAKNVNALSHAEFTANVTPSASVAWDIGPLIETVGASVNNTFCVPDTSGKLKFIQTGIFSVNLVSLPSNNPNAQYLSIKDSSDSIFLAINEKGSGSIKWENSVAAMIYVGSAPFTIFFRAQWGAAIPISSVVRVDRVRG